MSWFLCYSKISLNEIKCYLLFDLSFLCCSIFCSGSGSCGMKWLLAALCSQPQAGSKMDGELSSLQIDNSGSSSQKGKQNLWLGCFCILENSAFYLLYVCLSCSLTLPVFLPFNCQLQGLIDPSKFVELWKSCMQFITNLSVFLSFK